MKQIMILLVLALSLASCVPTGLVGHKQSVQNDTPPRAALKPLPKQTTMEDVNSKRTRKYSLSTPNRNGLFNNGKYKPKSNETASASRIVKNKRKVK